MDEIPIRAVPLEKNITPEYEYTANRKARRARHKKDSKKLKAKKKLIADMRAFFKPE